MFSAEKNQASMATPRRAMVLVVTTGLVLSLLTVGTVDQASAQSELTCRVGTLVADQCVEEAPPSSPGEAVCPTSVQVLSRAGECFMLVPKSGGDVCPTGSTPNDADKFCRQPVETINQLIGEAPVCPALFELRNDLGGVCARLVPASLADPACPLGTRGMAGACYEIAAAVDAEQLACPSGSTIDDYGLCRRPVSDLPGSLNCPDAGATLVGTECAWTMSAAEACSDVEATSGCEPTAPDCPAGFMTDAGLPGFCTRSEAASQDPSTCPDGARGTAGDCYILVAPGPRVGLCTAGELVGSICLIMGSPPVLSDAGALICAAGFGLLDGDCVRFEQATSPPVHCPAGSDEDDEGDCRKPVGDTVGAYYCQDSTAALQGDRCVFVADALVESNSTCPDQYEFDGNDLCVRTEPAIPSGPPCPSGTLGTAGNCFVFVELSSSESTCVRGVLVGPQLCRQPVADLEGRPYCEDPTAELRGSDCLLIAAESDGQASRYCPTGFAPDDSLGGLCVRFESASQLGPRCPEGSRGEPGACYILVAPGPGPQICDQGTLTGSVCLIVGNPPTSGPESCPVSAMVLGDVDFCYTLVSAPGGVCDAPLVAEPSDAAVCRRQVALRPAAPMCEPGYGIVDGQCITYGSPTRGAASCPAGTFADEAASSCRRRIDDAAGPVFCADPAAALNGSSCVFVADFLVGCDPASGACASERIVQLCPVSGNVVEAGDECTAVVPRVAATCATDTTEDADTTLCRKPVPLVQGPPSCPATFTPDGTRCIRTSAASGVSVFDCREVEDAICRMVVQTFQDAVPAKEFVARRATNLKYFGCPGGVAKFQVVRGTTIVASGQLTETSDGVYDQMYEVPSSGSHMLEVLIDCPDGSSNKATMLAVFIDPSGFVLDCVGNAVSGAEVTLSRASSATGTLGVVADGDATIMDPAINVANPSLTDADGRYRWDVVPGFYQVTASVAGQAVVKSEVLEVPPARTDVDLIFADLNCPAETVAEPTTGPAAQPTATPTTQPLVTRPQLQASPSYAGTTARDASTQPPVAPAIVAETATTTSLALTGNETTKTLMAALSVAAVGLSMLGASRRRRRALDEALG